MMVTRDRLLWVVFVLLVAGAVFFGTRSARHTAFLRRATLAELQAQAKRSPDDVETLQFLGEKQRASGRPSDAYDTFARAAELAPHNFAVWNATAELSEALHGRQGAFDLLGVYVRNNPKDGRGYLALARLYFVSQAHERATASAKQALECDPKLAEAWRIVGWEALVDNKPTEAEAAMRKAADIDPKDYRNLVGLGDVLATGGRFAEAVPLYRQAQRLAPNEPNVQIMLARALLRARPDDTAVVAEAEPLARRSLQQDDGRAITHVVLGEVFERKNELIQAAQEYQVRRAARPQIPRHFVPAGPAVPPAERHRPGSAVVPAAPRADGVHSRAIRSPTEDSANA
jgi:cytochrome c-type biogenesis protein CcmH/NrfG